MNTPALEVDLTKDKAPEARVLDACGRASMGAFNGIGEGHLQWGLLATPEALYTACQAAPNSGMVVRVPLGPGGTLVSAEAQGTFPLGKAVTDVLVDPGGRRLLLRAREVAGNPGTTVWVFDARKRRFTGAVAVTQASANDVALGLSPATGRLYALMNDYGATVGGRTVATRGGVQVSDARLDPAPPLENARPDLAYRGMFRIQADPVTRHVFVRRGQPTFRSQPRYPDTSETAAPAPTEPFYRVLRDDIAVAEQPGEIDDSAFTTDVAESELTRASYQGDGTGFGSRALLVGGADAATSQAVTATTSPCGKDDRELVAGSVGSVSVSDLSTVAEAAALDADARTRGLAPDLVDACGPKGTVGGTGLPATPGDTEQAAFDEPTGRTDADGRPTRTEVNHYGAACLGDEGTRRQRGFERQPKAGREAFAARVTCEAAEDKAEGTATGALSLAAFDAVQAEWAKEANDARPGTAPTEPVRVGYSSSEVTVTRKAGQGIEVRADSVARGIDIPGVGSIAVVRAEATSKATGRSGRAGGTFTRTICGVALVGQPATTGCLNKDQQRAFVAQLNAVLGARGQARLREPDPVLAAGSESGYRAALQRHRDDVFEDRSITRDNSPTVPGLELVFFQGDGDSRWGTGRQVLQLAGVQASTSYGITCLYGQLPTGRCAKAGEGFGSAAGSGGDGAFGPGGTVTETITTPGATVTVAGPARPAKESRLKTILYAPGRALQEGLRLLFNNPRELALMAAVWALLYAPCYLGERRRSIAGLRARRAAVGAGGLA